MHASPCGSWGNLHHGEPSQQPSGSPSAIHLVCGNSIAAWNTSYLASVLGKTFAILFSPNMIVFILVMSWRSETYKIAFWMRKYGAMSFKRTWIWSCSKRIQELDLGPLTPDEKKGCVQTTNRYVDKSGRTRFQGNAHLKRSQ